jgi:hypothetical protein
MYLVTPSYLSILLLAGSGVNGHHVTSSQHSCHAANISTADWKALNATVGGRLHAANPLAEACYSNYKNSFGEFAIGNKASCSTVEANYLDEHFHANQFGGYLNVRIVLFYQF